MPYYSQLTGTEDDGTEGTWLIAGPAGTERLFPRRGAPLANASEDEMAGRVGAEEVHGDPPLAGGRFGKTYGR